MTAQEIGLKVDTGQAESNLNKTAAAAENLEGKLQGVVDGTQAAGTAIEKLGTSAGTADADLADLAKSINAFLVERGKLAGKAPRLLDTKQDQQALQELKQQFLEMLNMTPSIKTDVLAANKGKIPSVPSQVNMAGYSPDPKKQADLMERMLTRLLSHNLATGKPIDTGLSAVDLNLRSLSRRPHEELDAPDPIKPKKPQSRDDEGSRGLFRAASHIPGRFMASGIGGVAGDAAGAAVQGATSGLGAFAGGGMAGLAAGAGIGLLGYGVYKGASALSEGVDKNKVEATETDKFKRSMGATSDAFDKLIQQSRMVGDAFLLTYDQSRKLSIEFANLSKVNDTKQAREGVGLAQAVGVDESQGVDLMATLRRDKSMGDTQHDAKIMAVQFAEALKRTGSTLNAGELMTALKSFSTGTAHASLGTANMEGFAGILSAMVGSKTPGLDVGNAAGILNQADAAFRSGGMMGEASQAEQFAVLVGRGQENGLMQLKQRQAGGLYATEADTVGNKDSPLNRLMGRDQAYLGKHQGKETAIEQLAGFANSKEDKEVATMQFANSYTGGDINRAAVLMRLQKEGHLGDTIGMFKKLGKTPEEVSAAGYMTMSEIAIDGKDKAGLDKIRTGLAGRADLTEPQKKQLEKLRGETDEGKLRDALMKFASTMEREKTTGEQIQENAVKTANATQRMADGLIPLSMAANGLLSTLVQWMAKDSPEAKAIAEDKRLKVVDASAAAAESGKISPHEIKKRNDEFDKEYSDAVGRSATPETLQEIQKRRIETLGSKATEPRKDGVKWDAPINSYSLRTGKKEGAPKFLSDEQLKAVNDEVNKARAARLAETERSEMIRTGKAPPDKAPGASAEPTSAEKAPIPGATENKPPSSHNEKSGTVTPEMDAKMLANDEKLAKINPDWKPGMTRAQFQVESNFNPNATSAKGAQGYSQVMPATRKLFEKREGRTFNAGNFDDDLELHRLHMTDDLKREGNVPDAQRAYNAGPDKSKWSNKETTAYVGKIEAARASPRSEVKKQVVVQPASGRAPIPTDIVAVNSSEGKAAMATANAIVAESARRQFAATDERRLDKPPEATAPKVASIVPQETPKPRLVPVDASAVKVASMTTDEPARIPGDRSMILPPEPVQLPSGNPQEQASNSRTQMDFSPLRVEGKFTLADQAGNPKADPIPYSGTFRRTMASGQQTVRA